MIKTIIDILKRLRDLFTNTDFMLSSLIFVCAFTIRLIYLNQIKNNPFFVPHSLDPLFYHNWAIKISSGNWIGDSVFKGLPFYAYFLAVIYKIFGINVYIPRLIQIVIGSINCVLLYFLGKNVFDRRTALLSCFLAVCYKPLIFYDNELIGSGLAIFFYLISILISVNFIKSYSPANGFIWGIATGIGALCRPSILIYPFISFFVLLFKLRKNRNLMFFWGFLSCFAGMGIILGATGLRNYIVGKDFVLLTAHSGINFYIGNNENSSGKMRSVQGIGRQGDKMIENSHRLAETELGRKLKPSESSEFWKKKAYKFIIFNPWKYFTLLMRKTYLFWQGGEIPDFVNIEFYERFSSIIRMPMVNFMFIVPWAVFGIIISLRFNSAKSMLRYFILSQFISAILYFVNSRYRLPVIPVLLLFSSYAVFDVIGAFRNRKKLVFYGVAITLLYFLLWVDMEKPKLSDDYNKLASWYLMEQKNTPKAIELFKQAYLLDQYNEFVIFNLARTYFENDQLDKAKEFFKKAVNLDKNDFESLNFIGIIYSKMGNQHKALLYFQKSLETNPNYHIALNNMATCYKILNKPDKVMQCYIRSLRLNPNQPEIKAELNKLNKP